MDKDELTKILRCGDASHDEQTEAAHKIEALRHQNAECELIIWQREQECERLREIAKAAYVNWAGGDPVDEHMTELGKLLGFQVDIP